jgi:hypothetical protein
MNESTNKLRGCQQPATAGRPFLLEPSRAIIVRRKELEDRHAA